MLSVFTLLCTHTFNYPNMRLYLPFVKMTNKAKKALTEGG